jgi:parallel beta-helix repeat protein
MIRKIVAVWVSLAMLFGIIVIVDIIPPARAVIITVDDSGGADFFTIQEAIDAAIPGDTVFVYSGSYYEELIVNKAITLMGEDKNTTFIEGDINGDAVKITADFVEMTNFTVRNNWPGFGSYVIRLDHVSNCKVSNNFIDSNSIQSIWVYYSHDNEISYNVVENVWYGIRLNGADRNLVLGNNASHNSYGIVVTDSDNTIITQNSFWNNTLSISHTDSRYTVISENTMLTSGMNIWGDLLSHWNTHTIETSNTVNGKPIYYWKNQTGGVIPLGAGQVFLGNCTNVTIENQDLTNNLIGINLGFSSRNNIIANNISIDKYYGIYLHYSNENNIFGNNASVATTNYWEGTFHLSYSDGNSIFDNNIYDTGYGISLDYSYSNTITGNNISNFTASGVRIYHSGSNYVTNNKFSGTSYAGVEIYHSEENDVTYNNVSSYNGYGITSEYSKGNNLTGNTLISCDVGIYILDSTDLNATLNNMIGSGFFIEGDILEYWNTHKIDTSNEVNSKPIYYLKNQTGGMIPSGAGQILLANCSTIIVENHTLANCSVGVESGFSSNNTIIANNISGNSRYGIYHYESPYSNITRNNVFTNNQGIYLDHSQYGIISNNNATSNILYGLFLDWSDYCKIYYNNASKNNNGITLENSDQCYITENIISSNNNIGINLRYLEYNNVTHNNVSNNNYGIYLTSSNNVIVFHNYLINNTEQARDNNNNHWNTTYPEGGNYWSDYTGVDYYKGPGQDIIGSDGIGDTEYSIDFNSIDHYPLMWEYKPLDNYTILKEGWNLISIPLIQLDQNLIKVIKTIDGYYSTVQWHDITDINDFWKHSNVGKSFGNDLSVLNESMGFWIYITQPGNKSITLHPGWNMVGYPSLINRTRDNALNNIDFNTDVDAIWTFNAVAQTWQEIGPGDSFELGRGYWIHSKVTKVWDVPL